MNKSNISKLKLFLLGLENRYAENLSIFKDINVVYSTGLKTFKGVAKIDNNLLKYNFNGVTKEISISELFNTITKEAERYDSLSLIYSERGEIISITADNKNVSMKNTQIKDIESNEKSKKDDFPGNTSTLLNRDYYIKVGKADDLLKEINIMIKDGKIKNDKVRKYNQIDHYVELLSEILDNLPRNKTINILDCGCGKSYLSFVLNYYFTEVKKRKCHFIGLDYSKSVIDSSKKIAQNLGYRNMEFHAVDIKDYKTDKNINVVISLHACDTATDMALALGIKLDSDIIISVPCCHKELLSQYKYDPLKSVLKHGVFKTRFADILTDGMRSLLLEAKGYDVSVVEYISPLETPKNIMIKAIKKYDENTEAMDEYMNLMYNFNVYPALYSYLNEW